MKTLMIHIGTHKTGTTAIQRFLATNRARLRQQGICYADSDTFSHAGIASALEKGDARPLQAAIGEIRSSGAESGLLSSEDFVRLPEALAEALGGEIEHTRIILYLRRQDDYVQALYQEQVKNPERRSTDTFETFYRQLPRRPDGIPTRLDWYGLVRKWAQAVGKERLIIRPYETLQFEGGSLFSDMLRAIGAQPDPSFKIPEPDTCNISYGYPIVELLRQTNGTRTREEQACLLEALNARTKTLRHSSGPAVFMSPAERRELLSLCESGNRRVATEFMSRPNGRLFSSPLPDRDEPAPMPPLEASQALPVLMELILHEYAHLRQLDRQVKDIRQRLIRTNLPDRIPANPSIPRLQARLDQWLIAAGGAFDSGFYLREYPDVRNAGIDPVTHFIQNGWREGRNPGPAFNTIEYLGRNPMVIAGGWSPLAYEVRHGLAGWISAGLRIRRRLSALCADRGLKRNGRGIIRRTRKVLHL